MTAVLSAISSPLFLSGLGVGALLMLIAGLSLIALIGRANDDIDPHAANLGTGAAWPDSTRNGSDQVHPRSRRSDFRSGPK